jgi:hypothetical protein
MICTPSLEQEHCLSPSACPDQFLPDSIPIAVAARHGSVRGCHGVPAYAASAPSRLGSRPRSCLLPLAAGTAAYEILYSAVARWNKNLDSARTAIVSPTRMPKLDAMAIQFQPDTVSCRMAVTA